MLPCNSQNHKIWRDFTVLDNSDKKSFYRELLEMKELVASATSSL